MRNPRILVVDQGEELLHQVERLAAALRPVPDVRSCDRMAAVADTLEADGPFAVLVAGPDLGTRAGLAQVAVIHEEHPGMATVLAFDRRPDASLRQLVRAGAVDLLQLPVDDAELAEALGRAMAVATTQAPPLPATLAAPAPPSSGADPLGRVFTISSATGGCGKTFFATNLAYFLARYTSKRVCIVDLDLQFGEVVTALRLRPRFTVFDVLERDENDEDTIAGHIEEYTIEHETGVRVLAAPRDPSEADRISPPDVSKIIAAVRRHYDYVVVDTPPQLSENVLAAFDQSDALYVMCTLDLPSVRNMSVFLSTLDRLKVPADDVRLVMNKAEPDVGIDIEQVTKLFPQGFRAVLPYAREVSRSINLGMPVMAASPNAEISRLMTSGLREALPDAQRDLVPDADPPKRGLFRRRS